MLFKLRHLRHFLAAMLAGITLFVFLHVSAAKTPVEPSKIEQGATSEIERELKRVQDSLSEVRRDQLNYQIEKNLLKETYSSNLQTINILLTMVLATFTILGYFGLKNVGALREKFDNELQEYRRLRNAMELQLKGFKEDQALAKTQVEKLTEENKEQDRRLKSLEIQEKVISLIKGKQFALALDYIRVGLNLTPNSVVLLLCQASCSGKLGRFTEAIDSYASVLKLEPEMHPAVQNLAECYALAGQPEELQRYLNAHRHVLEVRQPFFLEWYITAIDLFLKEDVNSLKTHVTKLLEKCRDETAELIPGWAYEESMIVISRQRNRPGAQLMMNIVKFFQGTINKAALATALASTT